ncbi:FAD-dependent oxidoreductase [Actinomadura sp. 6N118]|uniref:FAD-dependent oxidoreductase n=1 Tax=Actinomadura sp. 6N118 TaxID=3375151 RepID=UPI00379BFAB0
MAYERGDTPPTGDAAVEPVPLASVGSFDHEADVIIVGFGCAGAAAAFEAASAGTDVLVLERFSGAGGSSAQSGGEIYLGGGTSVQKACGFTDTPEDMYAYLEAALGPHADTEKLRLYCEGSVEHFEWLCARGVPFQESLYAEPAWMAPTEDGLMWLGEDAWPFSTLARPVPRGHRPPVAGYGGGLLMDKLVGAATEAGARCHTDTRAAALVVDESGRVAGVVARRFGETVRYLARKAVVLTTGGFVDNERMLADHAPVLLGHGKVSDGGDDGRGILMATAVGAATRRMASVEAALTVNPAMACRGILVNALGQRFTSEDGYPGRFSHAALGQPAPWWLILDEEGFSAASVGAPPDHVAETLAELEQDLGMPPGVLEISVHFYNRHAARGEDPLFHKDPKWLRELKAPFAAVDPRVAARFVENRREATGISGFTLGGLHTTVDGRVLHVSGRPIAGLYAAGRASSGIHGDGYVSGTSLGDGTFFGRRAGRSAAGSSH